MIIFPVASLITFWLTYLPAPYTLHSVQIAQHTLPLSSLCLAHAFSHYRILFFLSISMESLHIFQATN